MVQDGRMRKGWRDEGMEGCLDKDDGGRRCSAGRSCKVGVVGNQRGDPAPEPLLAS